MWWEDTMRAEQRVVIGDGGRASFFGSLISCPRVPSGQYQTWEDTASSHSF